MAQSGRRSLSVDDIFHMRDVRDAQRSPDGAWVAYTVTRAIADTDKNDTDLWMVRWDGTRQVQLTFGPDDETSPRWSPDGRYLAFLSSRLGAKRSQVWLLDRQGGEAEKATDVKGGVSDYVWAPDGKRLALIVRDPDPEQADEESDKDAEQAKKKKTPKPIVVDRYHFKQDVSGYLNARRPHLYTFDLATRKAEHLTPGDFEEALPAWSPDGKWIAFASRRGAGDIDRARNWDVFVVEPKAGAAPRQVTTSVLPDNEPGGSRLAWSPDSGRLAYVIGDEPKFSAYDQNRLAVIAVSGGTPRILTGELDRPVRSPHWSADGSTLSFIVTDDRAQYIASVPAAGGTVQKRSQGGRVITSLSPGPDDAFAVLASSDTEPPEVHALEQGRLRRLTHHNAWLSGVQLGTTEEFTSRSKDGTMVNGLIVKPAGDEKGRRYPTLLRIHGGPNGQDEHAFNFERELFAANGYVVAAVNYRGSNGRGAAFQKAIFADWGNKEVVDLLGAMDHLQAAGVADPERLGIGGWSYGGILTNYAIATDARFKAAISGAGSSNQISMYGTDQYITQYEEEIGPPWKAQDLWVKISYPFFHADRIKTPTLFMGGEKDFNVPLLGSEQMYQALRSLGVDTQLVIYPNQYHGITTPSYRKDRLERYLAWYGKYLKPRPASTSSQR